MLRAVDYLAARPDVDAAQITAVASGHLGLVLLHAAALDPRLRHITVVGALRSYRELISDPLPVDAPQDILPGVLRHYDVPTLVMLLGGRLTLNPQGPMGNAASTGTQAPRKRLPGQGAPATGLVF